MSMEIRGVSGYDPSVTNLPTAQTHAPAEPQPQPAPVDSHHLDKTISDLQTLSSWFNRRLEYTVDPELNRVVVKIVDATTDKVIRELPPKELQALYKQIREAIGLLFDKKV